MGEQTSEQVYGIDIICVTSSPAFPEPVMLNVLLWGHLIFNLQI